MKNSRWAVMWDCNGLEALVQIPDPSLTTFAILKNEKPPAPPNILHWKLRAQFNEQRHYEIYIFDTEPGIDREDIVQMFDTSPQNAADTIRSIGHCYHSSRATKKVAIV